MPGDGRVGLERQADLAEAGDRAAAPADRSTLAVREEAVDQQLGHAGAIDLDRDRAADQPAAAAQHGDRVLLRRRSAASSVSLAVRQECHRATDCQGSSFTPFSANRPATWWARARSMLSPPTSR